MELKAYLIKNQTYLKISNIEKSIGIPAPRLNRFINGTGKLKDFEQVKLKKWLEGLNYKSN